VSPRVPEVETLCTCGRGPGHLQVVRDLHVPIRTSRALSSANSSGGVRSRHVSAGAGPRPAARLPLEDSPTCRIQCRRRKCAVTQQSPRWLLPGCTIDRSLPRHIVPPLAPPTPRTSVCYASWTRRLSFAHHDAYAVDQLSTPQATLP